MHLDMQVDVTKVEKLTFLAKNLSFPGFQYRFIRHLECPSNLLQTDLATS